jgi:hypothetical protein
MKTIVLKTTAPFKFLTNSTGRPPAPSRFCLLLVPLLTVCLWAPPKAQAVSPPPDGCYPGLTTAEGCNALASLTAGIANTGVSWFSLNSNTDGSFNTAVGAGALDLNNGNENTAVGTGALLLNDVGINNTAVGAFALINNTNGGGSTAVGNRALQNQTSGGGSNTATGYHALIANTTGFNNAAYGVRPLESNIDGLNNTAIGNLALQSNVSNSNHVCVGRQAGSSITSVDNNIIIGHHNDVHSVFGQESDRCYIGNIYGAPVSNATVAFVFVDSDGRLGTMTADGPDPGGFSPKHMEPSVPDAKQAMFNRKVEKLQATVSQQQKQIETLMAQLKEQTELIQKVSAQLEVSKPAAKVVVNER